MHLRFHAGAFHYLCHRVESAIVTLLIPRRSQTHRQIVPESVPGLATFWLVKPGSSAAENLVLPLSRIVVQHLENQILTEVTSDVEGGSMRRARRKLQARRDSEGV